MDLDLQTSGTRSPSLTELIRNEESGENLRAITPRSLPNFPRMPIVASLAFRSTLFSLLKVPAVRQFSELLLTPEGNRSWPLRLHHCPELA